MYITLVLFHYKINFFNYLNQNVERLLKLYLLKNFKKEI